VKGRSPVLSLLFSLFTSYIFKTLLSIHTVSVSVPTPVRSLFCCVNTRAQHGSCASMLYITVRFPYIYEYYCKIMSLRPYCSSNSPQQLDRSLYGTYAMNPNTIHSNTEGRNIDRRRCRQVRVEDNNRCGDPKDTIRGRHECVACPTILCREHVWRDRVEHAVHDVARETVATVPIEEHCRRARRSRTEMEYAGYSYDTNTTTE
jgi:hypothetical protein